MFLVFIHWCLVFPPWCGVVRHRGIRACFQWLLWIGFFFKHNVFLIACVYIFFFKLGFISSPTPFEFSFYYASFELVKMELNPWACSRVYTCSLGSQPSYFGFMVIKNYALDSSCSNSMMNFQLDTSRTLLELFYFYFILCMSCFSVGSPSNMVFKHV